MQIRALSLAILCLSSVGAAQPLQSGGVDEPGPQTQTVREFLGAFQKVSHFNLTWNETTEEKLSAKSFERPADFPESLKALEIREVVGHLETALASNGFELERIGPEGLEVYHVKLAQDGVGQTTGFEVLALEFAQAGEAAKIVQELTGISAIKADVRTNSLLAQGSPEVLANIKEIVARIDVDVVSRMSAAGVADELFPLPSADMLIPVSEDGKEWTIKNLMDEYSRLTDQHFVVGTDTLGQLEGSTVGVNRSVIIPRDELQYFFEGILAKKDFVLTILRADSPRLLALTSLRTNARNSVRSSAPYVPIEELGAYARHPAMVINTIVTLPNTDVRQLTNSLRTIITDANTQQVLPAGNTNSIIVYGFAPFVAHMVRVLQKTDEAAFEEPLKTLFHRFQLEHAMAAEAALAIEELIRASHLRSLGPNSGNQQGIRRGHTDCRIVADGRTNSILVMAMSYDMPKVEELVALYDVEGGAD